MEETTYWKCDICGFDIKKKTRHRLHERFKMPENTLLPPANGWTRLVTGHNSAILVCPQHTIEIDGREFPFPEK
jgi:hypothetical protein